MYPISKFLRTLRRKKWSSSDKNFQSSLEKTPANLFIPACDPTHSLAWFSNDTEPNLFKILNLSAFK